MEDFLLEAGIDEVKNIMKELRLEVSHSSVIKLQLQGRWSLQRLAGTPTVFAWRLQRVQGAEREKSVHLLRLLAKRECPGALQTGGRHTLVVSFSVFRGQPWVSVEGSHSSPSGQVVS